MNTKKEKILQTVMSLLDNEEDLGQITVREIASRAEVNVALINYYFGSKEMLIQEAVANKMNLFTRTLLVQEPDQSIEERIVNFFISISDFSFQNYYLAKYSIQHDMNNGSVETIAILINPLREYYQNSKTELELKIIAAQLIIPIQSMFIHADKFYSFAYVDISKKETRDMMIKQIISNVLK